MGKSFLIFHFLFFSITALGVERSPSLPPGPEDLWQKICVYKKLRERPEAKISAFIAMFENIYNTNEIPTPELRREIFCLLKKIYVEEDPVYEQEFSAQSPDISCE